MTFEYVLENDTPLAFPDSVAIQENWVFDPMTNRYYDPKVETNENDYEYRSSQDRWVSHVDLSPRKVLDDAYVQIPGDVMTGGLQMGMDFINDTVPFFNAKRYDLEGLEYLESETLYLKTPHTLKSKEYVLGQRVSVEKNAVVYGVKKPAYETKWYKLKMNPVANNDTPPVVNVPDETDWGSAVLFHTGTTLVLSPDSVEGYSWIRTIQTITETSTDVNGTPTPATSICDTPMINVKSIL